MERNQIIYIDCMDHNEGLPSLQDKSVDISFFDPPYNAKKNYGTYKDNLPQDFYVKLMKKITNHCLRVSKNGIGVYVDSYRFKVWWHEIFPQSLPIIIWKRSPGFSNELKQYSSFHAILTNIKAQINIPNLWVGLHPVSDGIYWRLTKDYVSGTHPAQTSLEIVKKFISSHSKSNDLIIDPFMGTGSTAQACTELGRYYFGYEQNIDYKFNVEERLKDCKKESKQLSLKNYENRR